MWDIVRNNLWNDNFFVICHHHSTSSSAYVSIHPGHMVNDRDITFDKYIYPSFILMYIKYNPSDLYLEMAAFSHFS